MHILLISYILIVQMTQHHSKWLSENCENDLVSVAGIHALGAVKMDKSELSKIKMPTMLTWPSKMNPSNCKK